MISVSIVDDEKGLCESIATFVNSSPGFRCVSKYGSAEVALKNLPADQPDVVLMDINMASMDGIECVHRLKKLMPKVQVVMLTVYEDSDKIFRALAAGATGYLLKRCAPDELLQAIRDVLAGGSPMSHAIARKVVASFQATTSPADQENQLSPREERVLDCLARGLAYKQIGDELGISINTIRTHLQHIYEKLHVRSRTEAVAKYVRG
jgi:DNA-binding NarL/FixJ family response regulator